MHRKENSISEKPDLRSQVTSLFNLFSAVTTYTAKCWRISSSKGLRLTDMARDLRLAVKNSCSYWYIGVNWIDFVGVNLSVVNFVGVNYSVNMRCGLECSVDMIGVNCRVDLVGVF